MEVPPDVRRLWSTTKALHCVAVCAVCLEENLINLDWKSQPNTAIFNDVLFRGFSYIEA